VCALWWWSSRSLLDHHTVHTHTHTHNLYRGGKHVSYCLVYLASLKRTPETVNTMSALLRVSQPCIVFVLFPVVIHFLGSGLGQVYDVERSPWLYSWQRKSVSVINAHACVALTWPAAPKFERQGTFVPLHSMKANGGIAFAASASGESECSFIWWCSQPVCTCQERNRDSSDVSLSRSY
jgi:hypothetical protein